jgi:type IV pilus assembly protein PilP
MSLVRGFSMAVLLVVLAGCDGAEDFSDLDAYMNEMRLRAPGKIEPTPTFRSYPTFTYNAANLRSPFFPASQNRFGRSEAWVAKRQARP